MADFNVNAEVNLFKDLDHTSNRYGAASALHNEFCQLARPNQATVLSELVLAGGNTGSPWLPVYNGESYIVGLKPPEKDIIVSLNCNK
jgi:hypothetical protein